MPVRSNTVEFGRKLSNTAQTKATLTGADFGLKLFNPVITLEPDVVMIDPAGNSSRPLQTSRGMMLAKVSYEEEIIRGSGPINPKFFDSLAAAGFAIQTGVARMGAVAVNDADLTCELYDGLVKTTAYGVRGNVTISAGKVSERVMLSFSGTGHGEEVDQSAWPSGITDVITQGAILDACEMNIGGFVPELRSFSFSTEGEPTIIDNALAADGFVEPFLAKQKGLLRLNVWQHTKAARDYLAYLRGTSQNNHALSFTLPLGGGLELVLTGSMMLTKKPQRTVDQNVGTYPLEFEFDRTEDILFTQQAAA